jgi:CRP/FNR family cyclic AMP-dependent transcriptional regulator
MGRMASQPLHRKVFHAGELIFDEGQSGDRAYLVQKGLVQIIQRRKDGDRVMRQVRPGEVFGAMAAIDNGPRIASARAVEETVCVAVPRPLFEQKLAASDPLITALLRWFVAQTRGKQLH